MKKCTRMNVTGVVGRGAPRKTWSCAERDMKAMGIKEEMAQDRCAWRNITGVRPVLARMPDIQCVFVVMDVETHVMMMLRRMSAVYRRNSKGLSTVPCGTPQHTWVREDVFPAK